MSESKFLTLSEAARLVPTGNGKRVSTMTLWRWCSKGVSGITLNHYRFGKRIAVTAEDLEVFGRELAAQRPVSDAEPIADRPKTRTVDVSKREKQIGAAEARLRARGMTVGEG